MDVLRQKIEQLTEALEHRTVIGQALGLLMERFDLSDDEAFAFLSRCSSNQNRKLYEIAVDFVETRELPGDLPRTSTENVSSA